MTDGSNLVYVAGNIAAGKSTTSSRLAAALSGRLVTERADTNPYLADFYADMAAWTFHVDVHFLAERAATVVAEYEPGGPPAVFDRCYAEGAIFAGVAHDQGLATDAERATFTTLLAGFDAVLPAPSVLVYLRADPDVLLARVRARGRDYERGVTLEYLQALQEAYDAWVAAYSGARVISVDTTRTDLRDDAALATLAADVTASLVTF